MPGMKRRLIAYGAAVIVFLALDMVWGTVLTAASAGGGCLAARAAA